MSRSWFNHISVFADDVEKWAEFYEEIFAARRIATPNMGFPTQWLQIGDLQLHGYGGVEHSETPPLYGHFALGVEDFESVYRKCAERGIEDSAMWGFPLNELPSGQVQFYVRDPAGNLVEVDCADVASLPHDIRSKVNPLKKREPQNSVNMHARLALAKRDASKRCSEPAARVRGATPSSCIALQTCSR